MHNKQIETNKRKRDSNRDSQTLRETEKSVSERDTNRVNE